MIRLALTLFMTLSAMPALADVKITEVTSPGGIKAWLVEEHQIPFMALELRFRGGTSLDAAGKRGATELMASTLEEGAGPLDSKGFAQAREALAAHIKFDASADMVSVSAQFLTENRDQGLALLHSALVEPAFDQASLDRVKGQIRSIIAGNANDPQSVAGEKFGALVYGDHPYGSSEMGTDESIAALTRDDVLAAKAATMARDRLYVSAVGDITPAELGPLLDQLLGDLPATGAPMPQHANPQLTGKTTVFDFATPQSVVIFGQPGLKLKDPDYFAAFVLNQIVGGSGFSARLMNEVREKRGLTYGISTDLSPSDLAEVWSGGFASANEKAGEAITVVKQVWEDVAKNGVTEDELAAAKTYMTGSYPLRFDGNGTIASILVGMQMQGFPIDYPATRNARIEAVTLKDVNRVARERLTPDQLTFVVVGKPDGVSGN